MNVLLINPPNQNIIRESLPTVVEDSTGVYPPLGLLYIAAYAEEIAGNHVVVLDCQAEQLSYDDLAAHIRQLKPDVVGIQTMTFTVLDAIKVARLAKQIAPKALVILGGPHPTLYPRETAGLADVDAAVIGEGEFPFRNILNAHRDGQSLEGIRGVITKSTAIPADHEQHLDYIADLDELKMPSRHLLDLSRYSSPFAAGRKVTTMMSSRGCPAKCTFCDRPQMGKAFRRRSAVNVVREMAQCADDFGVDEIIFYDDTFTTDRQRVMDICQEIKRTNLKVSWDIRARIDTMTPAMIVALHEAGCIRIHYGVETASPRLQKTIRKNLDLNKVKEIFSLTRKAGIETLGYFMIGLPTETRVEVMQTLDFTLLLPMDYLHMAIFTPYPGTEDYRNALKNGFYDHDHWAEFARNPRLDFKPKFRNEHMSDVDLVALMNQAYFRFYYRPAYLLRELSKTRSAIDLLRKAGLGFKLLRSSLC